MLISAHHSLSLSPFCGHRILSLGGGPFWSWSMINNILPMGSSAVVSLHLTLLQFLEPIGGENHWVASVAKKYSAAFEVFVITMLWLSSTLTSRERTRFNRNETQNLTAKLQKVLMHWLNLADLTGLSMRQKREWWGRLGGQRGRNLSLKSGKITVYKGFQFYTNCWLCRRDNLVLPMMTVEVSISNAMSTYIYMFSSDTFQSPFKGN